MYLTLFFSSVVCFLTGNLDWVGNEFTYNTGAGLVISHPESVSEKRFTVVEQLQAVFERDWFSRYTRSLQTNKIPVCNKHQISNKVPDRAGRSGPAPMRAEPKRLRNHLNVDGLTPHEDRLRTFSDQSIAGEQAPVLIRHKEKSGIKMTHLEDRHTQNRDVALDPTSRSAESSGPL